MSTAQSYIATQNTLTRALLAMVEIMNGLPPDLDQTHSRILTSFFQMFGKLIQASSYRLLLTRVAYEDLEYDLFIQGDDIDTVADKYEVSREAVELFRLVYESQRGDECQTTL